MGGADNLPMFLSLVLGAVVGFVLGLFGGGGSVLAVPALVWGVGLAPRIAVAASLAVVGPAAAVGAVSHARRGNVALRPALTFGGPAIAASYLAGLVGRHLPDRAVLAGFGVLAAVVALHMFRPVSTDNTASPGTGRSLLAGVIAGSVTGLFGIGGGFIVVPALVLAMKLPMRKAVGTSLVVMAATAASALVARAGDLYPDPQLLVFGAAAVAGVLAGSATSRRTDSGVLKQGFAAILVAVAVALLVQATLNL